MCAMVQNKSEHQKAPNFLESRKVEVQVRRITLPRTSVNRVQSVMPTA